MNKIEYSKIWSFWIPNNDFIFLVNTKWSQKCPLDCLQEKKGFILVYCILNGLYSILNLGLNIVDCSTPGLLRNAVITSTKSGILGNLMIVIGTLIWMSLHGYFLWCTICLYRRIKFKVAATPPPSPPFLQSEEPGQDKDVEVSGTVSPPNFGHRTLTLDTLVKKH